MAARNLVLLAAAAAVAILPLTVTFTGEATFEGADNRAQAAILEMHPDYQPWFTPVWEPPSGEIASLLFALQAALGAGFLGYYFGLRRGQAPRQAEERSVTEHGADERHAAG
jgi:cobalt/nickel transport protein